MFASSVKLTSPKMSTVSTYYVQGVMMSTFAKRNQSQSQIIETLCRATLVNAFWGFG